MNPIQRLGLAATLAASICTAQDAAGCKDSPLLSRFPGSVISECGDKPDGAFEFAGAGAKKGDSRRIEGEFHQLMYQVPSAASMAQVGRNLNTALRAAGYIQDFAAEGAWSDYTWHRGKTWVQLHVDSEGFHRYRQTIVTEIGLKQEIVATAAELSTGLAATGHAVVNGILFDTGKAVLKPESAPALQEVAKLLKQDARLKLFVVGHTDNVGSLAANMDLSRQRAAAVVQALAAQYGVPGDRMQAFGAGPYAPVSSNDSEDGRTLNRRVEVVKQ